MLGVVAHIEGSCISVVGPPNVLGLFEVERKRVPLNKRKYLVKIGCVVLGCEAETEVLAKATASVEEHQKGMHCLINRTCTMGFVLEKACARRFLRD